MSKAVIMAGGQGERFWPLTHRRFPKYRIQFDGRQSLLQKTYRRLLSFYKPADIYVVTTRDHVRMIREELPALKTSNIIVEPLRKNTALAIYLSCKYLEKTDGRDQVVTFFPADHLIRSESLFTKTMSAAVNLAKKSPYLVTVGFEPSFPATGYGYIRVGKRIPGSASASSFAVDGFVEKPDRKKALRYLKDGRFLWNGGIFTWRLGVFLDAMRQAAPEFERHFDLSKLSKCYARLPKLSIDHALLEKTKAIAVVRTKMDWCDMGNWDMFKEKSAYDEKKNVIYGPCVLKESSNTLVLNYSRAPILTLGVKGIVVVQTSQGTLISKLGRSEEAARLNDRLSSLTDRL